MVTKSTFLEIPKYCSTQWINWQCDRGSMSQHFMPYTVRSNMIMVRSTCYFCPLMLLLTAYGIKCCVDVSIATCWKNPISCRNWDSTRSIRMGELDVYRVTQPIHCVCICSFKITNQPPEKKFNTRMSKVRVSVKHLATYQIGFPL